MNSDETPFEQRDEFWAELQQTFIEEAIDLLESCELFFMTLNDESQRVEALADIFRAYHSIKGSAAAIACKDLSAFAHIAEDCLAFFRSKPHTISSMAIDVLLKANDAIRNRVNTIPEFNDHDPNWDTGEIAEELKALVAEAGGLASVNEAGVSPLMLQHEDKDDIVKSDHESQQSEERPRLGELLLENGAITPDELNTALDKQQQLSGSSKTSNMAFKIDAARVDAIMDMLGELVVIKSQITEGLSEIPLEPRMRTLISQLDKSVRELHERTLSMRMVSLRSTFLKLQRGIKDVSQKLGKDVHFEVRGEDTEIDRAMIEKIADPLLHLCRNAVDHGIEVPEQRAKQAKDPKGHITLHAFRKGENVIIEIKDDGRGINKHAVVKKAVERGILPEGTDADSIADNDAFDILFHPGFSTAEKISDISGRGVGLDVVKSNIMAVGGIIDVESVLGKGSLFRLCLPLTTAITDGIVVTVSNKPFILPLDTVLGFFESETATILPIDENSALIRIKDTHYPFVRLGEFVGVEQDPHGLIVLIEALGKKLALQVDKVVGKTQVVLKPIGSSVGSTEGLGGAAVMGDGKVALIVDVAGLAAICERARLAKFQVEQQVENYR